MYLRSFTYTAVAHKIYELRHLRKVKLFPSVGALTVVTYYKQPADGPDYIGRAHLITFTNFKIMHIELAHNSHLPPPEQSEEEELDETELESDPLPAFGCSVRTPYYNYALIHNK